MAQNGTKILASATARQLAKTPLIVRREVPQEFGDLRVGYGD